MKLSICRLSAHLHNFRTHIYGTLYPGTYLALFWPPPPPPPPLSQVPLVLFAFSVALLPVTPLCLPHCHPHPCFPHHCSAYSYQLTQRQAALRFHLPPPLPVTLPASLTLSPILLLPLWHHRRRLALNNHTPRDHRIEMTC